MSKLTLTAALLMLCTTAVHVFAGGPEIILPMQESDLPHEIRSVLWVVWHGITLMLLAISGALAWLSTHRNTPLTTMVCTLMLGCAALFIVAGLQIPNGLVKLPQWGIFLAISALTIWGRIRS